MKKPSLLLMCLILSTCAFSQLRYQPQITHEPVMNLHAMKMAVSPEISPGQQEFLLGIMLGPSLFTSVPDENNTYGYLPGMNGSLYMAYMFSVSLAIAGELMFLQRGQAYRSDDYYSHIRRNYLQFNAMLTLAIMQSPLLALQAGPYVGYWLCGRGVYENKLTGDRNRYNEEFVETTYQELQRLELGAMLGLMFYHNLGPGLLQLGIRGGYGLTSYQTYDDGHHTSAYCHVGFMMMLGYAMALNQLFAQNR